MLDRWGPERCESVSADAAAAYCRRLTLGHYENFSVLSRVVPDRMRDGVCAIYAFCRWADDLSDEAGDPERARALLSWWRGELDAAFEGAPRHPVFTALCSVMDERPLPPEPFHALLDAFDQDQRVSRYETWTDVIAYCRGSADPVGRLVLELAGEPCTDEQFALSDAVCTGLQLANHWQDVRRDLLDRGRIYLPRDAHTIADFDERLLRTAHDGHAPDQAFLGEYRTLISSLVERTRPMLDSVHPLMRLIEPDLRPMIWLFAAGGGAILDAVEQSGCETVLHRVRLSKVRRAWLLWRAGRMSRAA